MESRTTKKRRQSVEVAVDVDEQPTDVVERRQNLDVVPIIDVDELTTDDDKELFYQRQRYARRGRHERRSNMQDEREESESEKRRKPS